MRGDANTMVKVFPNSFSVVEQQRLLTSVPGEPVAIACSEECLFVAEEGCLLEVFSLETLQLLGKFRTVSPVRDIVYNAKGDCIVTLERKSAVSHGFARVYFKWRGASVDRPMRISMLNSFSQDVGRPQDQVAAEIIELPGELNSPVTCLACCPESGRIAVGMDTTLRIFTLSSSPCGSEGGVSSEDGGRREDTPFWEGVAGAGSHSIEILMDIHTNTPLRKLAIFSDYVAFISSHEVRVLKLSILRDPDLLTQQIPFIPGEEFRPLSSASVSSASPASVSSTKHSHSQSSTVESITEDKNFVKWSPSRVWEEEKAAGSTPASTSSSLVDVSLPFLARSSRSHDSRGPSPIIGTLSLPSVSNSTSLKTGDKHAMEVLGPAEYIWGQPIRVKVEDTGARGTPIKCRVLTMLYRRFAPVKGVVNGEVPGQRAATLPAHSSLDESSRTSPPTQEIGLHTVQLLPIVITDEDSCRQLIGIGCFLADKFHGYLYDVHLQAHLVSSFSFMSPTQSVVCDSTFLHALSDESVETYTSRSLQAAIFHMPSQQAELHSEWLRRPCPSPTMDLTLLAASKFVNSYCLAATPNHMVVVTKSIEHAQSTANWLLTSLSPKKSDTTWNIYVLQKKTTAAMYQQFDELCSLFQDTSPPMYHHLLCEGHTLLRSQLLLQTHPSPLSRRATPQVPSPSPHAPPQAPSPGLRGPSPNHQASPQASSLSLQAPSPGPQGYSLGVSELVDSLRKSCLALSLSLCRYNSGKADISMAAKYLQLSRHSVRDIMQTFISQFPISASPPYAILLKYLDLVLFSGEAQDSNMMDPQPADTVLKLFADFRPHQLPQLLLNSWLHPAFTPSTALEVMATYLTDKSLRPAQISLGRLCELLLLLRLDHHQEAVAKLRELTDTFVLEWLGTNLKYLVDRGTQFTPLGKLLLRHRESCLLQVFYQALETGALDLDLLCTLLQEKGSDGNYSDQKLAENLPLKHFLDGIFLDKVKGLSPTTKHQARLLLVDLLVVRLTVPTTPPASSTPFPLYGSRYKWLDSLPPFDCPTPKPPQVLLQDLMQLQALLCSTHHASKQGHMTCSTDHMTGLASHLENGLVAGMVGEVSLKLLTWPHTGKIKQAVELVFESKPVLTVEYCETFLPQKLQHWKDLLDLLFKTCCSDHTPDTPPGGAVTQHQSPEPSQHTFLALYKAALDHTVSFCSPEEFLSLLPTSGHLTFFLPFIEKSCKLHLSRTLSHNLSSPSPS